MMNTLAERFWCPGPGGSIGSELCRQVLQCKPSKLVLLDVSEYALYQIYSELSDMLPEDATQIIPLLGSVTDRRSMIAAFAQHDVQIVLHAAAYKHVPLVERNVLAGIFNNVIGTATLAQAAALSGVERFRACFDRQGRASSGRDGGHETHGRNDRCRLGAKRRVVWQHRRKQCSAWFVSAMCWGRPVLSFRGFRSRSQWAGR